MKPIEINEYNLLRFRPVGTTTNPLQAEYGYGLHSGNRLWRNKHVSPLPALIGESYTFYTNFSAPTFNAADIVLLKDENCTYTKITDINEPSVTAETFGTNNLKITLTIPVNATLFQNIRIGVSDGEGATTWESNTQFSDINGVFKKAVKLSNGNVAICGDAMSYNGTPYNFMVLNQNGQLQFGVPFNGVVNSFVEQSDGKFICVGNFTDVNGSAYNRIVRLNSNGSVDTSFVVGSGASNVLTSVDVDSVGRVAVTGNSFFYNGSGSSYSGVRLTSTGAFDISYSISGTTNIIKYDNSDRLLRGITGGGAIRRYLTDGTLDSGFTTTVSGASTVNSIQVDGGNKVYLGGDGTLGYLIRLNDDGSTDGTFTPTLDGDVNSVVLDGTEVLVAGSFSNVNGQAVGYAAALDTTGVLDTTKQFNLTSTKQILLKLTSSYLVIAPSFSIQKFVGVVEVNVTHISNLFSVRPMDEVSINATHLFKFYHNSDIYGYEWSQFDPLVDEPYTIRIPSTNRGIEYPRDVTVYEAATTGRSRNTRATTRKDHSFQIYFRNDQDHDAIATLINFLYLEINQKEYLPLESYEPEYNDEMNIYVGNLKLRDVAYSVRIKGCSV